MKVGKRAVVVLTALLSAGILLAGCVGISGKGGDEGSSGKADTVSSEPAKALIRNPLTWESGYEETLLHQRPVAIMVNNIKASLPQKGIATADLVYELPVEGAVTRLMAVYANKDNIPTIGSIRSARHDFVELAKPLNAIYVHFGGSDAGFAAIQENVVDSLNGIELSHTAFFFEEQRHRSKAREHCWFTDGERIQAGIAKKGYQTTQEQTAVSPFRFITEDERKQSSYAHPIEAVKAVAPLSGEITATFTYNEASEAYVKGQYGQEHMDENSNEPVQVKNVFLLYPTVGLMADGLHKEVDLSQGEGWYLTHGRASKITFEKSSVDGLMKFYYAENRQGQELLVNEGKTWVCIAPDSYSAKLTLE